MLRPIDLTMTIQHAADAQRVNTNTQGRPEVAAQQVADRMEKQSKLDSSQVIKSNESEKSDVNPDREGFGGGYQPRKKKPQGKKSTDGKVKASNVSESLYDFKI
jgi:hypothetical protein